MESSFRSKVFLSCLELYLSSLFFNKRQTSISERFNFDKSKSFYYKVQLDTEKYIYEVFDVETNQRVGTNSEIKWFEYMNP